MIVTTVPAVVPVSPPVRIVLDMSLEEASRLWHLSYCSEGGDFYPKKRFHSVLSSQLLANGISSVNGCIIK